MDSGCCSTVLRAAIRPFAGLLADGHGENVTWNRVDDESKRDRACRGVVRNANVNLPYPDKAGSEAGEFDIAETISDRHAYGGLLRQTCRAIGGRKSYCPRRAF